MRRLVMLMLAGAAAMLLAVPSPNASLPGIGALRGVRQMLTCEAGVLGALARDPAATVQGSCLSGR